MTDHQPTLKFDKSYRLEDDQNITFYNFPVPPSSNKIYKHFDDKRKKKIIRVPTIHLINFKKLCVNWSLVNKKLCDQTNLYLRDEPHIRVVAYVALHASHIYTKDGKVRKMDVSNRGKALFDSLSAAIGVDDCHFFHTSIVKVIADDRETEKCLIVFNRYDIEKLADLT